MKLFLDVEGTLLVHARSGGDLLPRPADGLEQFLDWALAVADCFWLSGVDRTGGHEGILRAFRSTLGPIRYRELQPLLLTIRPTYWCRSKLEAIDLADKEPWFWIDDHHGEAELIILKALGLQGRAVNCPYNGLREVRATIEQNLLSVA
ncbi:MAG: hypothetical protein VR70_05185 [Rhodospirillaceae bacterium BRH_c57]|nr:MAG: hypothetical protein VR70_05185 [Rhodospirillaceae bacterium BRH_c57]